MESKQHPSTIGEMSPQHFEAYVAAIIKRVTGERFDVIERRLDNLDDEVGQLRTDMGDLKTWRTKTDENFEDLKDMLQLNQYRFGLIEKAIIRQDRKLQDVMV